MCHGNHDEWMNPIDFVGQKSKVKMYKYGYCIQGNFAPILFSPFSPSDLRANLKLG